MKIGEWNTLLSSTMIGKVHKTNDIMIDRQQHGRAIYEKNWEIGYIKHMIETVKELQGTSLQQCMQEVEAL